MRQLQHHLLHSSSPVNLGQRRQLSAVSCSLEIGDGSCSIPCCILQSNEIGVASAASCFCPEMLLLLLIAASAPARRWEAQSTPVPASPAVTQHCVAMPHGWFVHARAPARASFRASMRRRPVGPEPCERQSSWLAPFGGASPPILHTASEVLETSCINLLVHGCVCICLCRGVHLM